MIAKPHSITGLVLDFLRAKGLDQTSEIPVSEVAARLGYDRRTVQGAINGLRRRGVLPPASARKPRIDPGDWSRSSSWLWMLSPAPVILPAPTEAQIEEQSKQRREQVASYIREWKRLKRGGKPKVKKQEPDIEPVRVLQIEGLTPEECEQEAREYEQKKRASVRNLRPKAPVISGITWRPKDRLWYGNGQYMGRRFWTSGHPAEKWRECVQEYIEKIRANIQSVADRQRRISVIEAKLRGWDRGTHQPGGSDRAGSPNGG